MANLIEVADRALLREHPFIDPITQPAPLLKLSHIYPGDEIVLYHKISLPFDASVVSINSCRLMSAKVSLIAQRGQVFSEQFNRVFTSTRNMTLDSFSTQFTGVNAALIPWGSDGYAPNLTVRQDRNWRLPTGDFRREVNFFTKHVGATSSWQFWFYFPIIFRWEQWIAMLADNDFFDSTLPNNGQNQWWYHYYVAGRWTLKSRLELNLLVNGAETIIRSERDITPGATNVNDYNSNADWILKSIKTSAVGGVPSNTPCLVNGNRNTLVYAYFSKVSSWAADEQGNISAVLWVEPFQGAGLTARTRGSSLYPATPESVFSGLDTSLTDDSGTGITDGSGNFIVTNAYGNAAMVLFDGVNPEKIVVFGLIDYNKLNIAYPGVTKFTLYCRLYNSTLVTSGGGVIRTKQGEELKQDAVLISTFEDSNLCGALSPTCPFDLDVFASTEDTDDLKNDKSDFYQYDSALIDTISFVIEKNDSLCGDGAWSEKATIAVTRDNIANQSGISQSAYGRFFPFGTNPDFSGVAFEDRSGKKYTGLLLEWRKVLIAFGTGMYRMKFVRTDAFGNITTSYDQRIFCLKNYNCNLVDGSVRLEMVNEGERGTLDNPLVFIDYGSGWSGQIRLRGILYADKPGYTQEFVTYGDSKFNIKKPNIAELHPKYTLDIKPIPGWMDRYLENYFLLADTKLITDYNVANVVEYKKFPVVNEGGIESGRESLINPLAWTRLHLAYAHDNLRKRNSQ